MSYPEIVLKSGREKRILNGHLWVFSNEIEEPASSIAPGSCVRILSRKKQVLGTGFYNPHSLISARILSRKEEVIDEKFFTASIARAQSLRSRLLPGETSCRLVFGESDFLPGLVIDRYENHFVLQSYCLGMDLLTPLAVQGLKNNFQTESILKKNDSSLRKLENLKEEIEVLDGKMEAPVKFSQTLGDRKTYFFSDPLGGQKTGFFFDQRENRERLASWAEGKNVLDCFSYSGGFGVYAAMAGASGVTAIDSSSASCETLKKNFELNQVLGALKEVFCGDVQEVLQSFRAEKRKFDIIVLDPPSLAKSRKNLFSALRKYRKLNELALSLLSPDGLLFSCSCSHHVSRSDFLEMLNESSASMGRRALLLEMRGQSRDHPVLPAMPETDYLKCAVLTVN